MSRPAGGAAALAALLALACSGPARSPCLEAYDRCLQAARDGAALVRCLEERQACEEAE